MSLERRCDRCGGAPAPFMFMVGLWDTDKADKLENTFDVCSTECATLALEELVEPEAST